MVFKKDWKSDAQDSFNDERQPRRDDQARDTAGTYREFARDRRERGSDNSERRYNKDRGEGGYGNRRPNYGNSEGGERKSYNNRNNDYRSNRDDHSAREGGYQRRSYNPNFTPDNRFRDTEGNQGNRERRNYDNSERGGQRNYGNDNRKPYYNAERSGNRSYNNENQDNRGYRKPREEGYEGNRGRSYDNSERGGQRNYGNDNRKPYYNAERSGNREYSNENSENRGYRKPREEGYEGNRSGYDNRNRQGGGRPYGNAQRSNNRGGYGGERGGYGGERGGYGGERGGYRGNTGDRRQGNDGYRPRRQEHYPSYVSRDNDHSMRLNRYIAMSGICSRREADDFIRSGVVSVNGTIVTEMGTKVNPGDVVKFNDDTLRNENKVYILMNKPKGYVTSLDDPHADKTVMDLLKNACEERVYPVGRLDKNSLGVLLITNDGELTKRLTHPSYEKKKVYQVSLEKDLTRADMDRIVEGIELEDGLIFADAVSYIGDSKKEIGIEIHSGRNRIIRRIFEHLGYHVNKLDRVYFAGLTKKNLKRGQWRFLSRQEVEMLRSGMYE